MSLIALTGSPCAANDEIIVDGPTSVLLNCSYDNPLGPTVYTWYLDGVVQPAFSSYQANIPVSTGAHTVRCEARISDPSSADCNCEASQTLNIAAIGTQYVSPNTRITAILLFVTARSELRKVSLCFWRRQSVVFCLFMKDLGNRAELICANSTQRASISVHIYLVTTLYQVLQICTEDVFGPSLGRV